MSSLNHSIIENRRRRENNQNCKWKDKISGTWNIIVLKYWFGVLQDLLKDYFFNSGNSTFPAIEKIFFMKYIHKNSREWSAIECSIQNILTLIKDLIFILEMENYCYFSNHVFRTISICDFLVIKDSRPQKIIETSPSPRYPYTILIS